MLSMEVAMEPVRLSIHTRVGDKTVTMNSTLVETVSINYEDFNESFLTCSTCLCIYDGGEHIPKLLPCSHTVCLLCLSRIAQLHQNRDRDSEERETFRCPICRDVIGIPRGGVGALPPSFLVNQLLDLMARQRREVIPKCSTHINQELLFCETCDTVFCTRCTGGLHGSGSNTSSGEHTVVPFSIAIKRMSEILLYKANECLAKLNEAHSTVSEELSRLDASAREALNQVQLLFDQQVAVLERCKQDMLESVNRLHASKRSVLQEQLTLIANEKSKVDTECQGLNYQVEVRQLTDRIAALGDKLDSFHSLGEPRENAFLKFARYEETDQEDSHEFQLKQLLSRMGHPLTSTTFPSLCSLTKESEDPVWTHLETTLTLVTVDYHGHLRIDGGDPVTVQISNDADDDVAAEIVDCQNGRYFIRFRPPRTGKYRVDVRIFGRRIKSNPYVLECEDGHNPRISLEKAGHLQQPTAVGFVGDNHWAVVDTGNERILVLDDELKVLREIRYPCLIGRSATGFAVCHNRKSQSYASSCFYVLNWRSQLITQISLSDVTQVQEIRSPNLEEPLDLAVNSQKEFLVADAGLGCIVVLDTRGNVLRKIGEDKLKMITCVACGKNDEVLASAVGSRGIAVYSTDGEFLRWMGDSASTTSGSRSTMVHYGGIVFDGINHVLATKTEKNKSVIQVFLYDTGQLVFTIESVDCKLKRASRLATNVDRGEVMVADLGNDAVRVYRYL